MVLYANVFSDKDEERFGNSMVSGAHFYRDLDPENKENAVLKVSTWSTIYNLPSTMGILGNKISHTTSSYEFRMKYRFDVVPWLYWPKYFTLQLCAKNDIPILSLYFVTVGHDPNGGGSASRLCISLSDGKRLESTEMSAEAWYDLRIEYYPNKRAQTRSRLKIYVTRCGHAERLVYDEAVDCPSEEITKATIVYSATKIRGTQYFDDISFTVSDRKYSPEAEAPIPREKCTVYDFEDGIPSSRSFHIEMQLKKGDERATFDPSTWKSAAATSSFKNSQGFYEISLVLEGDGNFVTDKRDFPFSPGTIFITAPDCNHAVTAKDGYKILSVMGRFDKLGFIDDFCILKDNIYSEGKKLAELILYNRFGNEDYAEALCDAYIKYIITGMDRAPKSTTAAIYKIISLMEKNFAKSDLSVGELLDGSGYARDYIREEFFEVTKQTPKKYLNGIRMKNAKAMIDLYGEEMSLGEIAEKCGIIDSSVFSRIFRKHFGISPSEYRSSGK